MTEQTDQLLEAAIAAAVTAGNVLQRSYDDKLRISVKESLRDVVTEVDRVAEEAVVGTLQHRSPTLPIVAEEREPPPGHPVDRYWVVDALDGTVNYVNHIPFFCVSIALVEGEVPVLGAVYNPMAGDLYYGAEGVGVFKNQRRLVLEDRSAQESLFAVAFSGKSYDPPRRDEEFLAMGSVNDATRGCLRTGSAAMNLAYVAEGRFGGCWGRAGKYWDIAAGLVCAKLAGARVAWKLIDPARMLCSYLATVPGAWDPVAKRVGLVLGLDGGEQ